MVSEGKLGTICLLSSIKIIDNLDGFSLYHQLDGSILEIQRL